MPETSSSRYLLVADVASRLSVSGETARREIHRGNLYALRVGNQMRISEESLAEYIERQAIKGVPLRLEKNHK